MSIDRDESALAFDEVLVLGNRDDGDAASDVLYSFVAPGAPPAPGPAHLLVALVRGAATLATQVGGAPAAPRALGADLQGADGAWRDVRCAVLPLPSAAVSLVGVLWSGDGVRRGGAVAGGDGVGGAAAARAPPPVAPPAVDPPADALHAALVDVLLWLVCALGPPSPRLTSWGAGAAAVAAAADPVLRAIAGTRRAYALLRAAAGARGPARLGVAPPLRWAVDAALACAEDPAAAVVPGDTDGAPAALPIGGVLLVGGALITSHLCAADTEDVARCLALDAMAVPARGASTRRTARLLYAALDAGGRRVAGDDALCGHGAPGGVTYERRVVVAANSEDVVLAVLYAAREGALAPPTLDVLGADAIAGALHELRSSGALEALRAQSGDLGIRTTRLGPPLPPPPPAAETFAAADSGGGGVW